MSLVLKLGTGLLLTYNNNVNNKFTLENFLYAIWQGSGGSFDAVNRHQPVKVSEDGKW